MNNRATDRFVLALEGTSRTTPKTSGAQDNQNESLDKSGHASTNILSPSHEDLLATAPSPFLAPVIHDPIESSTQASPIIIVAPAESPETTNDAGEGTNANWTSSISKTKDSLKVTGRFIETLLKRLPDVTSGNPAKIVLGLAKMIVEFKQGVGDNMDAVERRIVSVAAQVETVVNAQEGWRPGSEDSKSIERFQTELLKLEELRKECMIRKYADFENDRSRIAEIFETINEARVQFQIEINLQVSQDVHSIQESLRRSLLKDLEPSHLADHKYYLEGEKKEVLRRVVCTPGTRERLLKEIVSWARDPDSRSPTIYWLFGAAGTGKSTIAYTIARRFDFAANDVIVLGGNFFCSRQFEETRFASRIIRTIAYHLALRCKAFAKVLSDSGRFDTIHQSVRTQIEALLIAPWKASESARRVDLSSSSKFLFVIDAVDEIIDNGGSYFLRSLLDAIDMHHLQDIKFFVTGRPDPVLRAHADSFTDKKLYSLELVSRDEVQADIRMYLGTALPHLHHNDTEKLVTAAAGLFIYAATVT
ncbi:hypothetical protein H0H93_000220, partial [Arthromyces matolae]